MKLSAEAKVFNGKAVTDSIIAKLQTGLMPALEKTADLVRDKFTNNPTYWARLSQATIQQRRYLGYPATPILFRTGHLRSVAVQEIEVDGPLEGHIGTSDPLAVGHNNGTKNIPGRPFYKLTDADRIVIFEAFKKGLQL